jgi:hypothetical protein
MRCKWSLSAASCLLTLTMTVPLYAQTAAPKEETNPCGEVESACRSAGFVDKGANVGKGLWSDCIDPIMQGRTVKAAKPLPKVNPQTVAACKAKSPNFGEPGKPKPKQ